jgi:hypothetical protein
MASTEIRLTLVFKPGYDGDITTVTVEDVVGIAEEIAKDQVVFEVDFVGYRIDQVESFEQMVFEPFNFTGEIVPDEEATDDHASHPEPENHSTQQELQPQ